MYKDDFALNNQQGLIYQKYNQIGKSLNWFDWVWLGFMVYQPL